MLATRLSNLPALPQVGLLAFVAILGFPSCESTKQSLSPETVTTLAKVSTHPLDRLQTLIHLDQLEATGNPAIAPTLFALMQNPKYHQDIRTRAAAVLCRLGFDEGQSFCLAVLTAGLADFTRRDEEFDLPMVDRWAFARELAIESLRDVLVRQGRMIPRFDVNFGAPDLASAARAIEATLTALPKPRPNLPRSSMARLLPLSLPAYWKHRRSSGSCLDSWQHARNLTLEACAK